MSKSLADHVEDIANPPIQKGKPDISKEHRDPNSIDPVVRARVVRKIDCFVIPFICITYLITYIDKAMLGYAAVFGLKEDLHLKGDEYSWLGKLITSLATSSILT